MNLLQRLIRLVGIDKSIAYTTGAQAVGAVGGFVTSMFIHAPTSVFHILFNMAVGGNYDGFKMPGDNEVPAQMKVAHVKWYQK